MFKLIEIEESIYGGVIEPSYEKPTGEYSNPAGPSSKMGGESILSNTFPGMSKSAGKNRKRYLDHSKDISKPTCLIHIPGYSSD